ncbi:uncharacterized protein LOC144478032 [Augochlora pura]
MIHSQSRLSNVQKLNYLQLSLSGEIAETIGAFTISDDNYEAAWNHLVDIFDNKRALVLRHAALLRGTPFMPDNSPNAIRDLANYMQMHLRSLQALGRTWEDIANDLMTSIAVSRMTKETRKVWEQTLTTPEVPKIQEIFKYLHIASHQSEDYASVAHIHKAPVTNPSSRVTRSNRDQQSVRPPRYRNSPPSSPIPQRRNAFVTKTKSADKTQCAFCKTGKHSTFQCPRFKEMNVEQRNEAVRNAKLCENCLLPGHSAKQCKFGNCRVCNAKHNTRLHRSQQSQFKEVETWQSDSSPQDSQS